MIHEQPSHCQPLLAKSLTSRTIDLNACRSIQSAHAKQVEEAMKNVEPKTQVDAPRYGLQHLIRIGRKMNSDEAKKGWYISELVDATSASDSSGHLRDRLRSGELFGLFERKPVLNEDTGVSKTQYFLTSLGKRFTSSSQESRIVGRDAIWNVPAFFSLYRRYVRTQLPRSEVLQSNLRELGLSYKEGGLKSVRRAFEQSLLYTMLMTPERHVQEVEIPLKGSETFGTPVLSNVPVSVATSNMVLDALARGVTDSMDWTLEDRMQWLKHVLLCWNLEFTHDSETLTIHIEESNESLLI